MMYSSFLHTTHNTEEAEGQKTKILLGYIYNNKAEQTYYFYINYEP